MDNIFPKGDPLPEQFADYFTGTATLKMLATEVKHWHGAAKDNWFSHLAVEVPAIGGAYEWLEPVTDEENNKLI